MVRKIDCAGGKIDAEIDLSRESEQKRESEKEIQKMLISLYIKNVSVPIKIGSETCHKRWVNNTVNVMQSKQN